MLRFLFYSFIEQESVTRRRVVGGDFLYSRKVARRGTSSQHAGSEGEVVAVMEGWKRIQRGTDQWFREARRSWLIHGSYKTGCDVKWGWGGWWPVRWGSPAIICSCCARDGATGRPRSLSTLSGGSAETQCSFCRHTRHKKGLNMLLLWATGNTELLGATRGASPPLHLSPRRRLRCLHE